MLNRRILRVKAMQALYGYFTAVESIKESKRADLKTTHSLDPAKHDFADKALFEARKKQAVSLFNQNLHNEEVLTEERVEDEVLQSVKDAIDTYHQSLSNESSLRRKGMMKEARAIQDSYLKLLILPMEIEHREKLEQEKNEKAHLSKAKRHYPFIGDPLIEALKNAETLNKAVSQHSISWAHELDEIKTWYREEIRPSEALKPYFEGTAKEGLVLALFKKIIFKNEPIVSAIEHQQLHWAENQPILKSMVVKTLKCLEDGEPFAFATLTKNGEEDFTFLDTLFTAVIKENDFLEALIQTHTQNWDVERIALTDQVILKLALVEMMNAPSIPVKVTINEAIEISKLYSTPKSKQFINGVLDVLSNELTSNGKIRKSGRGLIDNK